MYNFNQSYEIINENYFSCLIKQNDKVMLVSAATILNPYMNECYIRKVNIKKAIRKAQKLVSDIDGGYFIFE